MRQYNLHKMEKYHLFSKYLAKWNCFQIIWQNTTLWGLDIVKIEFCVECDITNIE